MDEKIDWQIISFNVIEEEKTWLENESKKEDRSLSSYLRVKLLKDFRK